MTSAHPMPQVVNGTVYFDSVPLKSFSFPYAYLEHDTAKAFYVSQLVYTATLGCFAWDILTTLAQDYRIIFKRTFRPITLAYICARWGSFGFVLLSWVFQCLSVSHCASLQLAAEISLFFGASGTAALFYGRVTALNNSSKRLKYVFGILLLFVIVSSLMIPVGRASKHHLIAPTEACMISSVASWGDIVYVATVINDSAVFFTTAFLLIRMAKEVRNTSRREMRSLSERFDLEKGCMTPISEEGISVAGTKRRLSDQIKRLRIPRMTSTVTRNLLKGGMQYYLVATLSNIVTLAVLASHLPANFRGMWTIPSMAVNAMMACRVFRDLALLLTRDQDQWEHQESVARWQEFSRRYGPTGLMSRFAGGNRDAQDNQNQAEEPAQGILPGSQSGSVYAPAYASSQLFGDGEISPRSSATFDRRDYRDSSSIGSCGDESPGQKKADELEDERPSVRPPLRRPPPAVTSNDASGLFLYDLGNTLDRCPPQQSKSNFDSHSGRGSQQKRRPTDALDGVVILRQKTPGTQVADKAAEDEQPRSSQ